MPPGASVPSTGPLRCWTTWLSSCAIVRWPVGEAASKWPLRNTTSLPTVYAFAPTDSADFDARLSVWTRTSLKSCPKPDSIDERVDSSSGDPPPLPMTSWTGDDCSSWATAPSRRASGQRPRCLPGAGGASATRRRGRPSAAAGEARRSTAPTSPARGSRAGARRRIPARTSRPPWHAEHRGHARRPQDVAGLRHGFLPDREWGAITHHRARARRAGPDAARRPRGHRARPRPGAGRQASGRAHGRTAVTRSSQVSPSPTRRSGRAARRC